MRPAVIVLLSSFIAISGTVQLPAQSVEEQGEIRVPVLSTLTVIDGSPIAYYELQYTNATRDTVMIEKLEIADLADLTVYDSYEGKELAARCRQYTGGRVITDSMLAPGAVSVIYIELGLESGSVKRKLLHRLSVRSLTNGTLSGTAGGIVTLKGITPVVLSAPLRDGQWTAVYLPSWERGHRRVIYNTNGKPAIPGRYAIDFVQVNEQGHYANGVEDSIQHWIGYGADVLAVADGVVASTRNDFQESETLSGHPDYPSEKATGNYISIKMNNGLFAFYEHLKPGSVKVKPGQRIRKGQVIAQVGFTGQTTGPHLHFHVADRNEPLGAEGVPFVFEQFILLGSYGNFEDFGKRRWDAPDGEDNTTKRKERPGPNSVIKFGN